MPDAQPKPTAAEVLDTHWDVCGDGSLCDCGWQRPLRPGAATPGRSMHLRHQADMLAAAGLLVTAEHDAQVLREAADAWHAEHQGIRPVPYRWLWDRADRIAAGGES